MSDGVTILAQWLSSWVTWANRFASLSLFSPLEMRVIIVSTSCIHIIYIHTYIYNLSPNGSVSLRSPDEHRESEGQCWLCSARDPTLHPSDGAERAGR